MSPLLLQTRPLPPQDYEDKEYNIKKEGKSYWEMGRLGPDLETEELQAKREKADRVKQMSAQVRRGWGSTAGRGEAVPQGKERQYCRKRGEGCQAGR